VHTVKLDCTLKVLPYRSLISPPWRLMTSVVALAALQYSIRTIQCWYFGPRPAQPSVFSLPQSLFSHPAFLFPLFTSSLLYYLLGATFRVGVLHHLTTNNIKYLVLFIILTSAARCSTYFARLVVNATE